MASCCSLSGKAASDAPKPTCYRPVLFFVIGWLIDLITLLPLSSGHMLLYWWCVSGATLALLWLNRHVYASKSPLVLGACMMPSLCVAAFGGAWWFPYSALWVKCLCVSVSHYYVHRLVIKPFSSKPIDYQMLAEWRKDLVRFSVELALQTTVLAFSLHALGAAWPYVIAFVCAWLVGLRVLFWAERQVEHPTFSAKDALSIAMLSSWLFSHAQLVWATFGRGALCCYYFCDVWKTLAVRMFSQDITHSVPSVANRAQQQKLDAAVSRFTERATRCVMVAAHVACQVWLVLAGASLLKALEVFLLVLIVACPCVVTLVVPSVMWALESAAPSTAPKLLPRQMQLVVLYYAISLFLATGGAQWSLGVVMRPWYAPLTMLCGQLALLLSAKWTVFCSRRANPVTPSACAGEIVPARTAEEMRVSCCDTSERLVRKPGSSQTVFRQEKSMVGHVTA